MCPEYPVLNYTLVVVNSEGGITTQISQAPGDVVNIAISGLREDTCYIYQVLATNQFGNSNPSISVEVCKCIECIVHNHGHKSKLVFYVVAVNDVCSVIKACPGTTTSKILYILTL